MAKNLSPGDIPGNMTLGGVAVAPNAVADTFAGHFQSKILSNLNKTRVDINGVYNSNQRNCINVVSHIKTSQFMCYFIILPL